jgi:multiple sugar transport system substrate-binding protein
MKRWLLLCLCALIALGATGCGGDEGSTGTAGTDPNKKITLEVWDWGVPLPAVMAKVDKAYMAEHPNITIKRVHQAATAYLPPGPLLRATVAKAKGPDLLLTYASPFLFDYVQGVRPVNDLVSEQDIADRTGWQATTRANGDKLQIPFDANGVIFYYDKAKFAKAGLDPEAPPQTWDELLTACDKLNAAGITPIGAGWKDGGYMFWWGTLFGAQYQTDEELGRAASDPDWATPAQGKVIDLIREARARKCFTPNAEAVNLFPDAVNDFKAGKSAMFVGLVAADVHWASFRETKWGKDGLGTFLAPLAPDSLWDTPRINYGVASGYFISKWSPNPQAAADFLLYLSSPAVQEQLYTEAGVAPANLKAKLDITDPVGKQIADWAADADPYMDQWTLASGTVGLFLVKYATQLVNGEKEFSEISGDMVAAQEKSPK